MDQVVRANLKAYYLCQTFFRLIRKGNKDDKLRNKEIWGQFNIKMVTYIICNDWDELTPCYMNGMSKKLSLKALN
jgi:hypothetical protein